MKNATTTQAVTFIDANGRKANLEIEIINGKLSISGDNGQEQDTIKPRTESQTRLIEIWNTYHLNDMQAGTPKQTALIKSEEFKIFREDMVRVTNEAKAELDKATKDLDNYRAESAKKGSISKVVENNYKRIFDESYKKYALVSNTDHYTHAVMFLELKGLLTDKHPVTGQPYKYGSEWLIAPLPENLQEEIDQLIEDIRQEEEERKGEPITYNDDSELVEIIEEHTMFSGDDANLCAALVKMFDLSINDLDDVEIDANNRVTVQGIEYLAGTDSEMDDLWDEDLENYIDECILPDLPENARRYFDNEAWKSDARMDGRAHSLNRYDDSEEEAEINGTSYFAYRQ